MSSKDVVYVLKCNFAFFCNSSVVIWFHGAQCGDDTNQSLGHARLLFHRVLERCYAAESNIVSLQIKVRHSSNIYLCCVRFLRLTLIRIYCARVNVSFLMTFNGKFMTPFSFSLAAARKVFSSPQWCALSAAKRRRKLNWFTQLCWKLLYYILCVRKCASRAAKCVLDSKHWSCQNL